MLIPEDWLGRVLWVMVSFTAGFCEETAFRGYLMTRLRVLGKLLNWVIPVIVSSVVFGACHAYQGLPGFILLTVYGVMFAFLYIRTESIWPCVIAHSLQDLGALFYPQSRRSTQIHTNIIFFIAGCLTAIGLITCCQQVQYDC